jgi:hypothetical protein
MMTIGESDVQHVGAAADGRHQDAGDLCSAEQVVVELGPIALNPFEVRRPRHRIPGEVTPGE